MHTMKSLRKKAILYTGILVGLLAIAVTCSAERATVAHAMHLEGR